MANGQREDGLKVLRSSAAAHRQLGRAGEAEQVEALIRAVGGEAGAE
jgi:hypothetical protein